MNLTGDDAVKEYDKKKSKGGMVISVLCRIIGIFLIVLVIAFAAALVVPRAFGCSMYNIMSDIMEPELPAGSIAYVKEAGSGEIEPGDIIVYDRENDEDPAVTVAAERVTEVDPDANTVLVESMNTVDISDIKGVAVFHLPFMGQFMVIYTTLPGKICLIGLALCGALLNVLAGRME